MLARRNWDLQSQAGKLLRSTQGRNCLGNSGPSGDVLHRAIADSWTPSLAGGVAKCAGSYAGLEQLSRLRGGALSVCPGLRDAPTPENYPPSGIGSTVLQTEARASPITQHFS